MSTHNHPWDDPRITAYVMQELSPTESVELEAEMRDQPKLAAAVDEAHRVTEKLADFYAAMPTSTLDASRRDQITEAAIGRPVKSGAGSRYRVPRITMWAIAASILFIAVALPLWQMQKTRIARKLPEPESAAPAPMLKAAPRRPMSPPSTTAPARSVPDADAKKNVEMAAPEENLNESLSIEDMSRGMRTDDMMSKNGMPADVTGRQASPAGTEKMMLRVMETDHVASPDAPGDKFSPVGENEFRAVSEHPRSTLSIDVGTTSYAMIRSYLQSNQLPNPGSVRIQDMVNYFVYDYPGIAEIDGQSSKPFSTAMTATVCPWKIEHRLVRVGVQAGGRIEEESLQDVKIQIEFNPAVVSAYRLIGYGNRILVQNDFNIDTKVAAEIGADHQVTALYEVVPIREDVAAVASPDVEQRYQATPKSEREPQDEPNVADEVIDVESVKPTSAEMLTVKLRYKQRHGAKSERMTRVLDDSQIPFDQADIDFRFAASVAAFGMLLRDSPFAGTWSYDNVRRVADQSIGPDPAGLRGEFVDLVRKAETLTARD